jgi:hypothetical protein
MVLQVIREALDAYRRLFAPLTAATILIFLPFAAALLALELVATDSVATRQGLVIIDVVGSVLLFAPLAAITAIRCGRGLETGGPVSVRRQVGDAFGLLVPYVLTQLLVLLVVVALPAVLIGAGFVAGSPLLMTLGFGLLFGSVLVNGVRLTVATVAVAVGDARYGPALRRSAGLTRGSWPRVLGTLVAASLMAFAVTLGLSAIALPFPAGAAQDVSAALAELIANGVSVPFVALASLRLYRALEARVHRPA